jgi:hypothetical protein
LYPLLFHDFHETCQMKLDPEEQIIAAALDQAELDDANERGVGARIEFGREGHARVTMTISRALVEKATTLNWSTGELFAEAIRIALPGAFNIEALGKATPRAA